MADISVKLNGDNSSFKRMLDDSSQAVGTIAGQISKKFEFKDLGRSMATALGINLQSIAENVARVLTGISKAEEDAYKKLEDVSARAADLSIKNMRALLTEEQRYAQALQDRDKLQREIESSTAKTAVEQLALAEKKIALEERIGEILAYEKKQRDEINKAADDADKQSIAFGEKKFQAELETLGVQERIKVLKQSIAQLEIVISSGVLDTKNKEQQVNILMERRLLLLKEQKNEQSKTEQLLTEFFGPLDEVSKKERERLENQKQINKELETQKEIVEETVVATEKLNQARSVEFGVSRENVTELSDTQLSALEIRARQNLSRAQAKQSASGSPFSVEKNEAADYLNQILAEVNLRRQFSSTQNFQGGQYNERNYDPTTFERLSRLFDPNIAKDQSRDIADISKNLRRLIGG